MTFKQSDYNRILKFVQKEFSILNDDLSPKMWIAWRMAIKRLFLAGFSVEEVLRAIPEASEKGHWPHGIAFWHRVRDVILKDRHEERKTMTSDDFSSLRAILKSHKVIHTNTT